MYINVKIVQLYPEHEGELAEAVLDVPAEVRRDDAGMEGVGRDAGAL